MNELQRLRAENEALKRQMGNAVGPVLAGAKVAIEKLRVLAIDAAAEWASSGGYRYAEVSGLVGAIEDAFNNPDGSHAVLRRQFARRVAEAVAKEYEMKLDMTPAGGLDIDLEAIIEAIP